MSLRQGSANIVGTLKSTTKSRGQQPLDEDHLAFRIGIRNTLQNFISGRGYQFTLPKCPVFTRLRPTEFQQLSEMGGEEFWHVNLGHYGPPDDIIDQVIQVACKIIKLGVNNNEYHQEPEIDKENLIILEQICVIKQITAKELEELILKNEKILINEPKKGIMTSVFNKYRDTMKLNNSEMQKIGFFARKFKVVGALPLKS